MHGANHGLPGAYDPPYPSEVVQSTKGCTPATTTSGPALNWAGIAAFFHAHLN